MTPVIAVSDGDSLTFLRVRGQVRVCLWGIDASESGQDFGQKAKLAASDLVWGKTVTVPPKSVDRFGRTVAEVPLPDRRSLNEAMVRSGMAWWYRSSPPREARVSNAQAEAKASGRGLWGIPDPIALWEWRRKPHGHLTSGVIGNRRSHDYHLPGCRGVMAMRAGNRVKFAPPEKAKAKGYRPAGDCHVAKD